MDKLDKFTPKDIKPLKDSPIAQGLISNAIFTVAWNGVWVMIAWIAGHYALIFGIPPFLAISLGVVLFFLMALSYNLLTRRRDAKALKAATEPPAAQLQPAPKPKLDFVIDTGQESHVNVQRGGGKANATRIIADIVLRCEKETDSAMVVRSFGLSLHRLEADGNVTTIPHVEDAQIVWENSKGSLVPLKEGWTIDKDKPRSEFRNYSFTLEIPSQVQAELSPDHFLQLTMDAIGQDEVTKAIYVKDWSEGSYSPISLKPFPVYPPEAQEEIRQLKGKLKDYEETNAKLGAKNQEYDWLLQEARTHWSAIDEYVSLKEFTFCYMTLTDDVSIVVFGLYITNNSVLDVRLDDKLDGVIRFEGTELLEPKRVISTMDTVPHGATRSLTIEQRLSPGEAKRIQAYSHTERANFEFDDLIVNIVGGKRSSDIKSKQLKIPRNTFVNAFPLNLAQRGQRIRCFSEIRGRAAQIFEQFRQGNLQPLPVDTLENWINYSQAELGRIFKPTEIKAVWKDITNGEPFPSPTGIAQEIWLETCIVNLGEIIVRDAGEYSKFLNP